MGESAGFSDMSDSGQSPEWAIATEDAISRNEDGKIKITDRTKASLI
jgi:hypothetical protein